MKNALALGFEMAALERDPNRMTLTHPRLTVIAGTYECALVFY